MAEPGQAPAPGTASTSDAWPLSRGAQIVAGFVLAMSNAMVLLDLTVANVSVPHIAGSLGVTMDQGAWIITSYAVAEAICVPLTGWLADRFGAVRMFMAAMFGFGLFSLVCGLSPTLGMLVAARIGQGICGAPLLPITQTLLLRVFPPERRNSAMALWSMTVFAAPALGPILGGAITDNLSWNWIFLINLPIAAGCLVAGWLCLRTVETPITRKPVDRVGIALLVFWIGCLQIMLDLGRDHDWFGDWRIVALAIAAGIGFVVFIIWELTEEHPVVDLRIFRYRNFTVAVFTLTFFFGAYFGGIVILPQWLQSTQGYTARDAGIVIAWTGATGIITGMFVSRLVDKVDVRYLITTGILWFAIMSFVRSGWTSGVDFWTLSWPQILQGLGVPLIMMPLTQMALGAVRPHEVSAAAGLQNFLRTLAIAVSTSVFLTIWGDQQRVSTNAMADVITPDSTIRALGERGIGTETARSVVGNLVDQQAMILALDHVYLLSMASALFAAALVWLAPRPKLLKQMKGAH